MDQSILADGFRSETAYICLDRKKKKERKKRSLSRNSPTSINSSERIRRCKHLVHAVGHSFPVQAISTLMLFQMGVEKPLIRKHLELLNLPLRVEPHQLHILAEEWFICPTTAAPRVSKKNDREGGKKKKKANPLKDREQKDEIVE